MPFIIGKGTKDELPLSQVVNLHVQSYVGRGTHFDVAHFPLHEQYLISSHNCLS